jgi:serine protease Do
MKSSILLIGLILSFLSGCAAAERPVLALAPDQVLDRTRQPPINARPKTKIAKQAQPRRPAQPVSASEPTLPPWNVASPKPSRILRSTLTPSQLFEKVSPAVYAVTALGQTTQQVPSHGSAVAVSSKEAITNCHVVANANAIMLANATATLRAEVVSADRATDRCFLRVLDGDLAPVPGLRDYASLAVGEVVFTIGSPKGLVNTLGHGLLSGLRRSEDAEYIQITAPVSEGSSGGGLFDDRGNLIGVTSFTIRDSQNLNFAIAASQFWR